MAYLELIFNFLKNGFELQNKTKTFKVLSVCVIKT